MAGVTRRGFITTSAGAAAGLATAGVAGGAISAALGSAAGNAVAANVDQTLVAYVRPGSHGNVTVVAGNREVTYHDPTLVRRMQKAAG